MGWVNGWAIFLADVLVMASLGLIASTYTFKLFGWHWAETHTGAGLVGCILWIVLMTWICYRGIELSARIQQMLLSVRDPDAGDLRGGRARGRLQRQRRRGSIKPQADWFNPFAMNFSDLVVAMLLGDLHLLGLGLGGRRSTRSPRTPTRGPGARRSSRRCCSSLIYLVVSGGRAGLPRDRLPGQRRKRRATSSTRSARGCSAPSE